MKYVIAARYDDKGDRIPEGERQRLVLDCQAAREIVAALNGRVNATHSDEGDSDNKAGGIL